MFLAHIGATACTVGVDLLQREVAACVEARNNDNIKINWLFDVDAARTKMAKHYPTPKTNTSLAA